MEKPGNKTLRSFGIILIVLGAVLILVGLFGSVIVQCPPNGCSPTALWQASLPLLISFGIGVSLVAIGIALLIASTRMNGTNTNAR